MCYRFCSLVCSFFFLSSHLPSVSELLIIFCCFLYTAWSVWQLFCPLNRIKLVSTANMTGVASCQVCARLKKTYSMQKSYPKVVFLESECPPFLTCNCGNCVTFCTVKIATSEEKEYHFCPIALSQNSGIYEPNSFWKVVMKSLAIGQMNVFVLLTSIHTTVLDCFSQFNSLSL